MSPFPLQNRPKITVAMIVRNAVELLEETLDSLRGIADEIVILDTGSTDETQRIGYNRATKFLRRSWDDSFSAARNACLAEASGDWLLWIDAGELLSEQGASELRQFVDNEAQPTTAYTLLVHVPQYGANIAGEQIARIRLVPNLPGIAFEGRIRESLDSSLARRGISIEALNCHLYRGSHHHDPQLKSRKAKRNIVLADIEIRESGPAPRLLNCIGDALQTLGDNTQASKFFQQSLALSQPASVDMLEAYYGLLTTLDEGAGNRPAQLELCRQALEIFPLDSQLLCAMGGYLQMQNRLDLAARAYQIAYQHGKVTDVTWHLDEIQEIAIACHALVQQLQNETESARQLLETAVSEFPESFRLRRHLIDLYVKNGLKNEAMAMARQIPDTVPMVEGFRDAVRGACLAQDRNWSAARAYLESGFRSGCREPLCLRWLTMTLVSMGDALSAQAIVDAWQQVEPMNQEMRSFREILRPESHSSSQIASEKPAGVGGQDAGEKRLRVDSPPGDSRGTLRAAITPAALPRSGERTS